MTVHTATGTHNIQAQPGTDDSKHLPAAQQAVQFRVGKGAMDFSAQQRADALIAWFKMRLRIPHWAAPVLTVILFGSAVWTIHNELGDRTYRSLSHSLRQIEVGEILLAAALALLSYGCLVCGERLASSLAGKDLPIRQVWRPSFVAYALGNSLGFSFATAPMARGRLYRDLLTPGDVAAVSALTGLAVTGGAATAAGLGLIAGSTDISAHGFGPVWVWWLAGGLLLTPLAFYLWIVAGPERAITIAGIDISKPDAPRAAMQTLFAIGDWAAAAGVLYVLLPDHAGWSYPAFLAVFIASGMLGAVSGSPGGLGVFEAAILALSPVSEHAPGAAAALVVYRLIYTLAPLGLAATLLGQDIVIPKGSASHRAAGRIGAAAIEIAPQVFAVLAFGSGIVLLLSSATPALHHRLQFLSTFAPIALVEASHFLASLTAILLMVIAAALWRRLEGAYFGALALLAAGAVFAIFKGLDVEEAIILALVAAALWPCRSAFTRKSRLLTQPLSLGWLIAVVGAVGAAGWLGLVAFNRVDYSNNLWWTFLENAQASRFLRAAAGVAIVTLLVSAWSLLASPRTRWRGRPPPEDVERARKIIAVAEVGHSDAHLALLGDKDLIFSPSGRSFLMFSRRGGRWITMGEPCGLASEQHDLLWRFMEMADENGGKPAFYSITEEMLPDFVDIGLTVRKIGETAIIQVQTFSLDGKKRASLRQGRNRIEREGVTFELMPPGSATPNCRDLKLISDEWLSQHEGAEKQFSLGRFDINYLDQTPLALIRHNGAIVAFANVWATADKHELSIDLMRYGASAPRNVMDFLFVSLIAWGKENGYRDFDLGMAPLAGLDAHRLAPAFSRLGAAVYEEGEALYGFRGLRAYKDKFEPDWRPLYIAVPPGTSVAGAMLDVTLLTSGGVRGLFG